MGRKAKRSSKSNKGKASTGAPSAEPGVEGGPKEQLLEEDGAATRKFKQVLVALFARFDVDGDKLLSEDELRAFSRAANVDDREFTDDELAEVRDNFDWKEEGSNGCGGLTLRGWMQMYVTQTAGGAEEETWADLHSLGYNDQLELQGADDKTPDDAGKSQAPKLRRPKSEKLRAALDRFVELGEAGSKAGGDLLSFVAAFVASDVPKEDQVAFVEDLRAGDGAQLTNLLAELRCCATGEGVFRIEEDDPDGGPVTIHFHSPTAGMERVDRAVVFVRDGDDWRAEG
mmetsp:Transcript_1106/g.2164  ORF Transcript_1106/g.2164 Transcript_1106/m.2164 type:complete len:286 (+) Transcript_1106:129-986(+)